MPNLLEDPLPVIFAGIVVEAVLGLMLLKTGRGVLLAAMAAVLAVVLLGVGVERLVVTEGERVEATIDGVVAGMLANDLQQVLSHLDPAAQQSRQRARWAMGRVEFTAVRVRNLRIKINRLTSPPAAVARFHGAMSFRDRKGEFPYENYAAPFTVEFRLKGDRWLVTGHTEEDPRGANVR